jgi:hypothetical protein
MEVYTHALAVVSWVEPNKLQHSCLHMELRVDPWSETLVVRYKHAGTTVGRIFFKIFSFRFFDYKTTVLLSAMGPK